MSLRTNRLACVVFLSVFLSVFSMARVYADWPTIRGSATRTARVPGEIRPPFRIAWVRHFADERMSSVLEPVTSGGKVFVATHTGSVYALDALSGEPAWRFKAHGAFLHSPVVDDGAVIAGSTDGFLCCVDVATGKRRWSIFLASGGFAASPLAMDGTVFIGTRSGSFAAVDPMTGAVRWRRELGAPIRQTAAGSSGRVFVTSEDLRVHCLEAATGKELWTSAQLEGQSARGYFPVLQKAGGREYVIVRTSPSINMAQRIARDRQALCRSAGVDDGDWKKLDAWTKSEAALGNAALWQKEQAAIVEHLQSEPEARTFFVLDAATGKETPLAPVLWCAGCQGTGSPPVALDDGRLLVFTRSAYGNWNHGVAPLVSLGILDLATNRIAPLVHQRGMQPPWNTFWGTADESQCFEVVGDTLLIIHQSTLSGFDLKSGDLFAIAGERDGWAGFRNLPWARNEWNGPLRGGVAVDGTRLYWQSGSRLVCIACGEADVKDSREDVEIDGSRVPTVEAPEPPPPERSRLTGLLAEAVSELISRRWAPLVFEPGLAGREIAFEQSGEVFEALSLAYPHLSLELKLRVKAWLAKEWKEHPPFTQKAWYSLEEGERREYHRVPHASLVQAAHESRMQPLGNLPAVALYASKVGETAWMQSSWELIEAALDEFLATKWRVDPEKGNLDANRYLIALLELTGIALTTGHPDAVARTKERTQETSDHLVAWWRRSSERAALPVVRNITEWDAFLSQGDALFFAVKPHKAKIALFHGLTPNVAAIVKKAAPEAVEKIWRTFETLCPTWYLAGEERQVHYGENFADAPDFSLDAFRAFALLRDAPFAELARRIDVPCCRADLGYIVKIALTLNSDAK